MQFSSTNFLHYVLREIAEEIEQVDPTNPALAQFRFTSEQKSAELVHSPWTISATEFLVHMSPQPNRPLLEALREVLKRSEGEPGPEPTPSRFLGAFSASVSPNPKRSTISSAIKNGRPIKPMVSRVQYGILINSRLVFPPFR